MHWVDKLVTEIIDSGKYQPYWVDDMKTPSGRVHIGSVRAFLTHAFIAQAVREQGKQVKFTYVLEDHDPFDKLPAYLDQVKFKPHLGKPLYKIPSPEPGFATYGERWGMEYMEIFKTLGIEVEVIWGSQLYLSGKMNGVIRECLDKADVIRDIYMELYKKPRPNDWYPFNVACEQCGKLLTTYVNNWDGEQVNYECRVNQVEWTQGCGHQGKMSPFSGNGKLPWKVEWPCKWKVVGVTIEGAGKDHMSAGSSHDFAKLVCERVINYPVPFAFSHEFFLIGGRKMSSSKGVGSSAKDIASLIPAYLLKFAIARVKYNQQINFDPYGMTIPDLFDDYDEAALAYWRQMNSIAARSFVLAQIGEVEEKEYFLARFRDIVQFMQDPKINLEELFAERKGSALTKRELEVLRERLDYAQKWLDSYAPKEFVFQMAGEELKDEARLSVKQTTYLAAVIDLLEGKNTFEPEKLQQQLYELAKQQDISTKEAFQALYLLLLGKTYGPKIAWLICENPNEAKLRLMSSLDKTSVEKVMDTEDKFIQKEATGELNKFFYIDPTLLSQFPGMFAGVAVIKNINVTINVDGLEEVKKHILEGLKGLTTDQISSFPSIQAYRKLFKKFGVDYTSRRPSPDALLRRIAQGKILYNINTLVDAYNLVVLETKIGLGAFDLDKLSLPVNLRLAKEGERVHLLGDSEETAIHEGEMVYADQEKVITLDLNYRDAAATGVTERTKNVIVFADGCEGIDREEVKNALEKAVERITQFCGGEVEFKGVIE